MRQLYFWREKKHDSMCIPQQRHLPRPRVKSSRDRSPSRLQSRNLSSSSRLRLSRYEQLSISTSSTKVSDRHTKTYNLVHAGRTRPHQHHPSSRFRPNVQSHATHLTSGSAHGALLDAGGGRSQPQLGRLPVSSLCGDNGLWRQRRLLLGRSRKSPPHRRTKE